MVKRIILFPGQGSLNVEKAKKMYSDNKTIRNNFEKISDYLNFDLYLKLDQNEINDIYIISYLIFTLSLSTFQILEQEKSLENAILVGHSLGEIIRNKKFILFCFA